MKVVDDDLGRVEMRREPRRPLPNLDCSWELGDDVGDDQVPRLWTCGGNQYLPRQTTFIEQLVYRRREGTTCRQPGGW
jgi:hypothetical protein